MIDDLFLRKLPWRRRGEVVFPATIGFGVGFSSALSEFYGGVLLLVTKAWASFPVLRGSSRGEVWGRGRGGDNSPSYLWVAGISDFAVVRSRGCAINNLG